MITLQKKELKLAIKNVQVRVFPSRLLEFDLNFNGNLLSRRMHFLFLIPQT